VPKKLDTLAEKANNLPLAPGVYLMLDEKENVIYVGKAKKLKNRVSSYFHGEHLPKVAAMVEKIADFNVIVANSEFEALVLENSLIKKYKPHYNILLKDDKGYPFIRLDSAADYPRFSLSSTAPRDGAEYFGPFGGRNASKEIIETISKTLLLPTCSRKFPRDIGKDRPCLNYHLGTCAGWCLKDTDPKDYQKAIEQARLILDGKTKDLTGKLTEEMNEASENLRFEVAASLRDRIRAVEDLSRRQRVISTVFADTDAVGFYYGAKSAFVVMHYKDGNLVGKDVELIDEPVENAEDAVSSCLRQYYLTKKAIPKTILLSYELEDAGEIEQWLRESSGHKVTLEVPKRGERTRLTETADMNAREESIRRTTAEQRRLGALEVLQKMLQLPEFPERIEAYDISNLGDTGIVSAMTTHKNGRPLKSAYRKFRIRDLEVRDDYESMRQTLRRRFQRYLDGDEKFAPLPDLMLIDGGQTHAAAVEEVAADMGISVPVWGMVKDDRHRTRALINAEGKEVSIDTNQSVFSLIGNIQEETHRSAITYQRKVRNSEFSSGLDKIPGVGEARRNRLLSRFKTIKAIKEASVEELAEVVPRNTAESIYSYYRSDES